MPDILIYTTAICPYCVMAKRLLDKKGVTYKEINVDSAPGLREELMQKIMPMCLTTSIVIYQKSSKKTCA